MANLLFLDQDHARCVFQGLIIAGSAGLKDQFTECAVLSPVLVKSIARVLDVEYGGTSGLHAAISQVTDLLNGTRAVVEKKLAGKFLEEIATGELWTCGPQATVSALEEGAVETAIVWDKLKTQIVTISISNQAPSNQGGNSTAKVSNTRFAFVESDKAVVNLKTVEGEKVISKEPFIDWLIREASEHGSKVEILTDSTPESNQFCVGFGVGALLRFQVNCHGDEEEYQEGGNDLYEEEELVL